MTDCLMWNQHNCTFECGNVDCAALIAASSQSQWICFGLSAGWSFLNRSKTYLYVNVVLFVVAMNAKGARQPLREPVNLRNWQICSEWFYQVVSFEKLMTYSNVFTMYRIHLIEQNRCRLHGSIHEHVITFGQKLQSLVRCKYNDALFLIRSIVME